jgi:DoxX-like family
MGDLNTALILFSAVSFLAYGAGCFASRYLEREFQRYGFAGQRQLIGFLQLCGSAGLIAGHWFPPLGIAGAGGLSLMMFVAIIVRIRIRDSFLKTLPAIGYFLLNTWIALCSY